MPPCRPHPPAAPTLTQRALQRRLGLVEPLPRGRIHHKHEGVALAVVLVPDRPQPRLAPQVPQHQGGAVGVDPRDVEAHGGDHLVGVESWDAGEEGLDALQG